MKNYNSLQTALVDIAGTDDEPEIRPISGGDINRAYRLAVGGQNIFMKANQPKMLPLFEAEI